MEATYTTEELRNFFEWQLEQVNPMLHRKNKDCWNGATVDSLVASPVAVRGAVETMDRAERRLKLRRDAGAGPGGEQAAGERRGAVRCRS